MQCDKCLHNKNNVCMVDASMSSAKFEHCYDFEDKTIYLRGAREFAEWLGIKEEHVDAVLSEWQKRGENE